MELLESTDIDGGSAGTDPVSTDFSQGNTQRGESIERTFEPRPTIQTKSPEDVANLLKNRIAPSVLRILHGFNIRDANAVKTLLEGKVSRHLGSDRFVVGEETSSEPLRFAAVDKSRANTKKSINWTLGVTEDGKVSLGIEML